MFDIASVSKFNMPSSMSSGVTYVVVFMISRTCICAIPPKPISERDFTVTHAGTRNQHAEWTFDSEHS